MVDEAQRQRTTFPDAREQYIASTHDGLPEQIQQSNIDRIGQNLKETQSHYQSDYIPHHSGKFYRNIYHETPQTFPDWVIQNPNAFEMMNEWSKPGGKSWMGSPMWMDAKNKTYGLPGTEVAQSKWKEKFQSIIDMIMNRENLDERDAKRYIFDNYGLAV